MIEIMDTHIARKKQINHVCHINSELVNYQLEIGLICRSTNKHIISVRKEIAKIMGIKRVL